LPAPGVFLLLEVKKLLKLLCFAVFLADAQSFFCFFF